MIAPLVGQEWGSLALGRRFTDRSAGSEIVYDTGRVKQNTVLDQVTYSVRNLVIETTVIDIGEYREGQAKRDEDAQRESRGHLKLCEENFWEIAKVRSSGELVVSLLQSYDSKLLCKFRAN